MPSNQWGPFDPSVSPAPPLGTGVPSAPPVAPQSPSGAITTDTGETESATETYLDTMFGANLASTSLVVPVTLAGLSPVSIQQNSWQSSCVAKVTS
jgi:hypothetical protein